MSSSYNRVILVGNLTRKPDLNYTPENLAVCDTAIAVNEPPRKGQETGDVMFIDLVFFGRTAEVVAAYLTSGSLLLVEGKLRFQTWQSDGKNRSKHKLLCDRMQMLGQKPQQAAVTAEAPEPQEIPF